MSEDEKKAIEDLKKLKIGIGYINIIAKEKDYVDIKAIDIVLNLIEKQQKEYISKDKIREKIKELEQIKCTALTERTIEMMEDKINILNLILKEDEK